MTPMEVKFGKVVVTSVLLDCHAAAVRHGCVIGLSSSLPASYKESQWKNWQEVLGQQADKMAGM